MNSIYEKQKNDLEESLTFLFCIGSIQFCNEDCQLTRRQILNSKEENMTGGLGGGVRDM